MPAALERLCAEPGCGELTTDTRCDRHVRERDAKRGSAAARGYGGAWQKARVAFLKKHPWCECEDCRQLGRHRIATVVDHRIPHRGDRTLFWDRATNWTAMAKRCHDRKTATQDGGFGR